jgi:DNA polymerase III delta prime subunit
MSALTPSCMDDFLFSNVADQQKLELILQRRLPFPLVGKSGILLHGTWGTGKSTLAQLLPGLLETAYSNTWNLAGGIGQMPPPVPDHCQTEIFRCGGGLSSTSITQSINQFNSKMPIWHFSQNNYFVFDEIDRLTIGAQKSLRSTMDLPRSMFFMTTNYLSKIDLGIVNRCHLIEMNQMTSPSAYVAKGQTMLQHMGLNPGVVSVTTLQGFAKNARGSMRDFSTSVVLEGVSQGGVVP